MTLTTTAMLFPSTVYRCPGPHWGPPGTTYESRGVSDASELAARLAEGWHATLPEAADAYLAPPAPEPAPPAPEPAVEAVMGEIECTVRIAGLELLGVRTRRLEARSTEVIDLWRAG